MAECDSEKKHFNKDQNKIQGNQQGSRTISIKTEPLQTIAPTISLYKVK